MKQFNKTIILIFLLLTFTALCFSQNSPEKLKAGSLTNEFIEQLQNSFKPIGTEKRLVDAVINNPIREIAINQTVVQQHNKLFSHVIKTGRATNQKSTGRCWMYAALNVLRPFVIKKLNLNNFEFSQNHLYFWDKIEKANTFLERVIDRADLDIRSDKFQRILKNPIEDGGYWQTFTNLIKKYGVVPQCVMPETNTTGSSRQMRRNINEKLRLAAYKIRELKNKSAMRKEKEKQLTEVYKMLVFHLGVPPTEFEYRYKSKAPEGKRLAKMMEKIIRESGVDDFEKTEAFEALDKEKVSVLKTYTPQSFAREFVTEYLDDFVMLANWPARKFGILYHVELTNNTVEGVPLNFLNVELESMKMACLQSVLNDDPVDFSADVAHGLDRKSGIMNSDLYEYEEIYGVKIKGPKKKASVLGQVVSHHAMVLMGVDIVNDKIVKWRVENSWSTKSGDQGFFFMYDNWFDDYVVRAVVKKKYLPQRLLKLLDQKPTIIPENEPEM